MSRKMGYILIILGLAIVVWGIFMVFVPRNTEETNSRDFQPLVESEKRVVTKKPVVTKKNTTNDYEENKAKGDAFEKFVVKSFPRKFFTLQEWRSDKYVDGIYAVSNHFPDLEVMFDDKSKGVKDVFAIECKWRKRFYHNEIEWAQDYQIKNYKEYADRVNIPVYVVIGMSGEPEAPDEIFIIPLSGINSNTISKTELNKYKKDTNERHFIWDYENKVLR